VMESRAWTDYKIRTSRAMTARIQMRFPSGKESEACGPGLFGLISDLRTIALGKLVEAGGARKEDFAFTSNYVYSSTLPVGSLETVQNMRPLPTAGAVGQRPHFAKVVARYFR